MKCDLCGANLKIAKTRLFSEKDSTDVFNEITMVCINPKCENYSGTNLNNPLKIAKVIQKKVN